MPKQYRPIAGKAVLAHAVDALASHPAIDAVRVVIGEGQEELAREALGDRAVGELIIGGASAPTASAPACGAIEDGRRAGPRRRPPLLPAGVIDRLLDALEPHDGAVPVLPVADTLARANGSLGEPIDRERRGAGADAAGLPLRGPASTPMRAGGPQPDRRGQVARAAGLKWRRSRAIRCSRS